MRSQPQPSRSHGRSSGSDPARSRRSAVSRSRCSAVSPPPPRSTASDSRETATATRDWSVRSNPTGRPTARKPRTVPLAPSGCSTTRSGPTSRADELSRPRALKTPTSSRSAAACSVATVGAAARTRPDGSSTRTQAASPRARRAATAGTASAPRAARVRSRWVSKARVVASYSCAATIAETDLEMAMNGVASGTSSTTSPWSAAASSSASGTAGWVRPTPSPYAATPASTRCPTYADQAGPSSAPRRMPVESRSSPPSRKLRGSSSSLTATQRTGRSWPSAVRTDPPRRTRPRLGRSTTLRTLGAGWDGIPVSSSRARRPTREACGRRQQFVRQVQR